MVASCQRWLLESELVSCRKAASSLKPLSHLSSLWLCKLGLSKHRYLAFFPHPQGLNLADLAPAGCVAVILLESSGPALRQCHREAERPRALLAGPLLPVLGGAGSLDPPLGLVIYVSASGAG